MAAALIASAVEADAEHMQAQIGYINYPGGEYRDLTADTNDYSKVGIAKDGKTLVAIQSKLRLNLSYCTGQRSGPVASGPSAITIAPVAVELDAGRPPAHSAGGNLKAVSGQRRGDHALLRSETCSGPGGGLRGGRYIVFRLLGGTSIASANLSRMDLNGTNLKQLTTGLNDQEPSCAATGNWVYYVDNADNRYVKRISVEGGSPETVVKYAIGAYSLSPDGKEIVSFELRELDHKLMLRVDNVETHQMAYSDMDQRALAQAKLAYAPDGKGVVYRGSRKGRGQPVAATAGRQGPPPTHPLQERQDLPFCVFAGRLTNRHRIRRTPNPTPYCFTTNRSNYFTRSRRLGARRCLAAHSNRAARVPGIPCVLAFQS